MTTWSGDSGGYRGSLLYRRHQAEQQGKAWDELKTIIARAAGERRGLSRAERERWDDLMDALGMKPGSLLPPAQTGIALVFTVDGTEGGAL